MMLKNGVSQSRGPPEVLWRGWGGAGTQKMVYQKWPKDKCPSVNFILSHSMMVRGREGGGGGLGTYAKSIS